MRLDEIHPTIQNVVGLHEVLRRLGFLPKDIYLRLESGKLQVAIVQRGTALSVAVAGPYEKDEAGLATEWATVASAVNNGDLSDDDMEACLKGAATPGKVSEIASSILRAGFRVPGKYSN